MKYMPTLDTYRQFPLMSFYLNMEDHLLYQEVIQSAQEHMQDTGLGIITQNGRF